MAGIRFSLASEIRRWRLTVFIGLGLTTRPGEACRAVTSTARSISSSVLANAACGTRPSVGALSWIAFNNAFADAKAKIAKKKPLPDAEEDEEEDDE